MLLYYAVSILIIQELAHAHGLLTKDWPKIV